MTDESSGKVKQPWLSSELISAIEISRKFVLNPLSHAHIVNIERKDVEEAIQAVERLVEALNQ